METYSSLDFNTLPYMVIVALFKQFGTKERQLLREVSRSWKRAIDETFGVHIVASNLNWDWVENCGNARTAVIKSLSRDIFTPCRLAEQLSKLEITDFIAYYSFFHFLEDCFNLRSLTLRNLSFLPNTKLPQLTCPSYIDGSQRKWLPQLTEFFYQTHQPLVIADEVEQMNLGRRRQDEGEFLPMMFQVLQNTPLKSMKFNLGDMWRLPFLTLFGNISQVAPQQPRENEEDDNMLSMTLYRAAELPLGLLGKALNGLEVCKFYFPFRDDHFFMRFHPDTFPNKFFNGIPQLEKVVIRPFFKWGSNEGRDLDSTWMHILENQYYLKKLHYSFPIASGEDLRMARVIYNSRLELEHITFSGHRDVDEELRFANPMVNRRTVPWDASWFLECTALTKITFDFPNRTLFTVNFTSLVNPQLLPSCLKELKLTGTINLGNGSMQQKLCHLKNLEVLDLQVRNFPWFISMNGPCNELGIIDFYRLVRCLSSLKSLKLTWGEKIDVEWMGMGNQAMGEDAIAPVNTGISDQLRSYLLTADNIVFKETNIKGWNLSLKHLGLEIVILPAFDRLFPDKVFKEALLHVMA